MRILRRVSGMLCPGLLILLVLGSLIGPLASARGEHNLYVHQAQAFLHGHLDIPKYYHDVAVFQGRYYVPFPPFPALLILPVVVLVGVTRTNTVLISLLLSVPIGWLLKDILKRLAVGREEQKWMSAAFFAGTVYWSALRMSRGVWFLAHIVAVLCLFAALWLALQKRAFFAGLCLGLAFLSRQLCIYFAPFLLFVIWQGSTAPLKWRMAVRFAVAVGLCMAAYLIFNWARFGNPFDTGYVYLRLHGFLKERFDRYGLFSLRYVPFNFYHLFVEGFHVGFEGPAQLAGWKLSPFGTSLLVASPFVLLAARAQWRRSLLISAWISIGLIVVQTLFYYNNGWVQYNGQRFSLDFMPVLMVLTALGAKRSPAWSWKPLIIWAIGLNTLALVVLPLIGGL